LPEAEPGGGAGEAFRTDGALRAITSSLIAFLAAVLRPRTPLAKAIVLILLIKLIGIAGIKMFMFPDSGQPRADAATIARVIGVSARQ